MLSVCCLSVVMAIILQPAFCMTYNCSNIYQRVPVNSDLKVYCGTTIINLEVNLCTALYAGFNTTSLSLNGSQCKGMIDTSVDPPIIRYQLPFNDTQDNCLQSYQIVDGAPDPSSPFSSFSSLQSLPQGTLISYATDLKYHFSCNYQLEYFLNNTNLVTSAVSVATNGNNGTFLNTLSMSVFNDTNYVYPLVVPPTGLPLCTGVYVEVKATNLTGKIPRFSFETFRFVSQGNMERSTIYVHCILRMCEQSKCQQLLSNINMLKRLDSSCSCSIFAVRVGKMVTGLKYTTTSCNRRKRSLEPFGTESTDSATVSLGPLYSQGKSSNASQTGNGGTESGGLVNYTALLVGIVFGTMAIWPKEAGISRSNSCL